MSKRSSKVYIRINDIIYDFMYAFTGSDNSVMLSFAKSGNESIELILDQNFGELRKGDFIERQSVENPKISFHASGRYKLTTNIGLTENTIDRCTVLGPRLESITEPHRMMEVLVPNKLEQAKNAISGRDIVLDASMVNGQPLRCTIFCMPKSTFSRVAHTESDIRMVDTSQYEFVHGLETNGYVWVFVLRVSVNDKEPHKRLHFCIPGEIVWGNRAVSI